jgi:hypothetical protein
MLWPRIGPLLRSFGMKINGDGVFYKEAAPPEFETTAEFRFRLRLFRGKGGRVAFVPRQRGIAGK